MVLSFLAQYGFLVIAKCLHCLQGPRSTSPSQGSTSGPRRKRNRRLKETLHHAGPRRTTPNLHNLIFNFSLLSIQRRILLSRVLLGTRFPSSVIFFSILPFVEGLSCFQLITNFFLPVASNSVPTNLRANHVCVPLCGRF